VVAVVFVFVSPLSRVLCDLALVVAVALVVVVSSSSCRVLHQLKQH